MYQVRSLSRAIISIMFLIICQRKCSLWQGRMTQSHQLQQRKTNILMKTNYNWGPSHQPNTMSNMPSGASIHLSKNSGAYYTGTRVWAIHLVDISYMPRAVKRYMNCYCYSTLYKSVRFKRISWRLIPFTYFHEQLTFLVILMYICWWSSQQVTGFGSMEQAYAFFMSMAMKEIHCWSLLRSDRSQLCMQTSYLYSQPHIHTYIQTSPCINSFCGPGEKSSNCRWYIE